MKISARYIASRVLGSAVIALVFFGCHKAFGATVTQPDFTTVTKQLAFAGAVYALLSVASLAAVAYAAIQGAALVLAMIRGTDAPDDDYAGGYWEERGGDNFLFDEDGNELGRYTDSERDEIDG
ncbi:hypothetical protein [Salinisphaera hydrothermalis]|uniref:hypothetical protein n=1 Tax=Salinisphaera hydrothermalis TaxID=563188 RepID=UPI003342B1FF